MNTATKPRFTYNDIFDTIREYHWMIRELERLKKTQTDGSVVEYETKRQREKRERIEDFAERLKFIEDHMNLITEKERVIFDCILDGMFLTKTADHLGMSLKAVSRTRDRFVQRLYESQYEGESK